MEKEPRAPGSQPHQPYSKLSGPQYTKAKTESMCSDSEFPRPESTGPGWLLGVEREPRHSGSEPHNPYSKLSGPCGCPDAEVEPKIPNSQLCHPHPTPAVCHQDPKCLSEAKIVSKYQGTQPPDPCSEPIGPHCLLRVGEKPRHLGSEPPDPHFNPHGSRERCPGSAPISESASPHSIRGAEKEPRCPDLSPVLSQTPGERTQVSRLYLHMDVQSQ